MIGFKTSRLSLSMALLVVFSSSSTRPDDVDVDWTILLQRVPVIEAAENADGIPGVRALFVVAAPKECVWAVLLDYASYPKMFEGILKTRVLEQSEYGARVEFQIKAVLFKYEYVLDRRYEIPGRRLTWRRVSGDFKRIEGSWELRDTPQPARTLIIYESYVQVGGVIPVGLVRRMALGKAKDMSERLRDWIEDGPAVCSQQE